MVDSRPKPSIPAWQRAPITPPTEDPVYSQPKGAADSAAEKSETQTSSTTAWKQSPTTPPTEDPVYSQPADEADSSADKSADKSDAKAETSSSDSKSSSTSAWQQSSSTPPSEDPVYSQAVDTSNSTGESSSPTGEAVPSRSQNAANTQESRTSASNYVSDFQSSNSSTQLALRAPPASQVPTTPTAAPPPIITYPEFLVRAHRPPPLITPARLGNALTLAGGLAALLYGTSRYLVEPMVDSLGAARHEFYTHSQEKVDALNARLSGLVSKVPAAAVKKEQGEAEAAAADDAESVTSDPTELYHRDMGTQTDGELSSAAAALKKAAASPESAPEAALARDTKALAAIESHLQEILDGSQTNAETARERLDSINKLRHYLDQLCYAGAGINVWTGNEDRANGTAGGTNKPEDAIESLKKEIRSVKGVLLSAKRFPSLTAGGRVGAVVAGAA